MNRDEELYAAAFALPVAERTAFLIKECAGDAALRAHVEALLAANDEADAFFAVAAVPRPAERVQEKAGDRIGRYKLLQKIGEGGCGVVYMAEQEEPVRRRVALKVIKLGMDTKAVIARFEAERQALALMEHPNIARVLDAGATETGRPFFVMELVRGIPITRYCDEENLSTAERLQLFIQVCHAIQHAHHKGIVHRDIKPSNILVTMHDDVPTPKVIDFGIAKATQGRLTDQTVFTAFEQFIGTPAYMSPEQAQFNDADVDTRSDIYSLGVLLYELLTGRPPFDPKTLQQQGIDEIRRIIREVEPPRPSICLNTLSDADRAAMAKARRMAPAQLSTLVRGDLDWIAMKAIEKKRARRYETAGALAADVKRHLSHEPVVARPPSTAYRLQKFGARHRFALGAAAAIAVALTTGLTLPRVLDRNGPNGGTLLTSSRPSSSAGIRTLVAGTGDDVGGVLSPDETKIAFVDWNDSSNVMVKTLASGAVQRLTSSVTKTPGAYSAADTDPVWSPDSKHIAYGWYREKEKEKSENLTITSMGDGRTRVLIARSLDISYVPHDWSADGKFLLCELRHKNPRSRGLALVSVESAEVREFFSWEPNREPYPLNNVADAHHPRLSPDGRFVVFDRKVAGNHDVYVVAIETRELMRLTDARTSELNPVWSRDGKLILFSGDGRGTWDLWGLRFAHGKPEGAAFLVKADFGNHRKRITQSGNLAFNVHFGESDGFSVDVTPNGPAHIGPPKPIAETFLGQNRSPTWSPDGLRVAYVRKDSLLCIQTIATGRAETVETGMRQIKKIGWSPDGKWMLMAPGGPKAFGPHAFNLETHELKLLLDIKQDLGGGGTDTKIMGWSGDGAEVIVRVYPSEKPRYLAVNVSDGRKREVRFNDAPEPIEYFDFSRDQTRVAYATRAGRDGTVELKVTDSAFRNPTTVARLGVIPRFGTMEGRNDSGVWPRWSPDGRMISYYRKVDKMELHVVASDGGWDQAVNAGTLNIDQNRGPAEWSPDGKKIAMTLVGPDRGEIGMLENFLPTEEVAAK